MYVYCYNPAKKLSRQETNLFSYFFFSWKMILVIILTFKLKITDLQFVEIQNSECSLDSHKRSRTTNYQFWPGTVNTPFFVGLNTNIRNRQQSLCVFNSFIIITKKKRIEIKFKLLSYGYIAEMEFSQIKKELIKILGYFPLE